MNVPPIALLKLSLRQIADLGQKVYEAHQILEKWCNPPLTANERTKKSVELEGYLQKQREWIDSIEASFTDEE